MSGANVDAPPVGAVVDAPIGAGSGALSAAAAAAGGGDDGAFALFVGLVGASGCACAGAGAGEAGVDMATFQRVSMHQDMLQTKRRVKSLKIKRVVCDCRVPTPLFL